MLISLFITGCLDGTNPVTSIDDEPITTAHPSESLSAKSSTTGGNIVKTYENTIGATLGTGYNSVKDAASQIKCITYDAPKTFDGGSISSVGQFATNYNYIKSESTTDISSSMNVSIGATVNYGMFSGSASGDVLSSTEKSSHDLYVYVYIDVTGPSASITNVALTQEFKDKASATDVYEICGDYYAGTITTGGRLHAILQFSSTSESEKQTIKSDVTAAMEGIGSLSSSSTSALSSVATQYSATISSFATGCEAYIVGNDMDSFQAAVDAFPQKVTDCVNGKNAEATKADLEVVTDTATDENLGASVANIMSMAAKVTYFSMTPLIENAFGTTNTVADVLQKKRNIADLIYSYNSYQSLDTDIQSILDNRELYDWTGVTTSTVEELEAVQAQINAYSGGDLDILQTAMDTCSLQTFQCEYPSSGLTDIAATRANFPTHGSTYPKDCAEFHEILDEDVDQQAKTIYLNGNSEKPINVWCEYDEKNIMSTYLDLDHNNLYTAHPSEDITNNFYSQGKNYSGFVNYWNWKKHNSLYWSDLITVYRKVKIHNMDARFAYIDICDSKFATSATYPLTTESYPLGNSSGCAQNVVYKAPYAAGVGSINGRSKKANGMTYTNAVDLNNTPFVLSEDMIWEISGSSVSGSYTISDNRKTATIQVQGNNGYFKPRVGDPRGPVSIKLEYQN
ncbi:MAG: hypothetical protein C0603_12460 [Denitrovibrio sp.]|nr:MAG: hypothetical protein C0603_12460 [Denitrovibrio sp.]